MRRFYSKVDTWTAVILWGTLIVTWGICIPLFFRESSTGMWLLFTTLIPTTLLLGSIFFNTYYKIDQEYLYWHTGPFRGKVQLSSIREIKRCSSIMEISSIMKPSLSFKPLLIKYNKYEDIPVSPEEEGEFIDAVKRGNPDMKIELQKG